MARPLPERPSSSGPQAKRQKSEEGTESQASIITRLSDHAYKSVDEVIEDIETAVSDITEKLQLPNGAAQNQLPTVSPSEVPLKVAAFKQYAHELVRREKAAADKNAMGTRISSKPLGYSTNGLGTNLITEVDASKTDNKTVLTLYGNAPVPKQLFSSLQVPTNVSREEGIMQTLREAGLPTGIFTTQVVPLKATGLMDEKKRPPTLGELFPTPSTVPALRVPTQSKIANTKSSTVGWYQPTNSDILPRNGSYFKQPISTGQWLDYSNASITTPGSKKKQRDRTLSLSVAKAPQFEA